MGETGSSPSALHDVRRGACWSAQNAPAAAAEEAAEASAAAPQAPTSGKRSRASSSAGAKAAQRSTAPFDYLVQQVCTFLGCSVKRLVQAHFVQQLSQQCRFTWHQDHSDMSLSESMITAVVVCLKGEWTGMVRRAWTVFLFGCCFLVKNEERAACLAAMADDCSMDDVDTRTDSQLDREATEFIAAHDGNDHVEDLLSSSSTSAAAALPASAKISGEPASTGNESEPDEYDDDDNEYDDSYGSLMDAGRNALAGASQAAAEDTDDGRNRQTSVSAQERTGGIRGYR